MRSAPGQGSACSTSRPGPATWQPGAADRGADSVGLDFSETMLAYARARSPQRRVRSRRRDRAAVRGRLLRCRHVRVSALASRPAGGCGRRGRARARARRSRGVHRLGRPFAEPLARRGAGCCHGGGSAAASPTCHPARRCSSSRTTATFSRLLSDAGLVDVLVEAVEFPLELETGDELWTGSSKAACACGRSSSRSRRRCSARYAQHFETLVEEYRTEEGFGSRSRSSWLPGENRPSPKCPSRRAARRPASTRASHAGGGRS